MVYLLGFKSTKDDKLNSVEFYEVSVGSKKDGIEGQFDVEDMDIPFNDVVKGYEYDYKPSRKPGAFDIVRVNPDEKRYFIGTLQFGSREDLIRIAQNYTERLGKVLLEIYQQLENLTNNVNVYFLENNKEAAVKAQQSANLLKKETEAVSYTHLRAHET